ncbi:tetratricopeptide repeat protein [Spirosoma pulveris]
MHYLRIGLFFFLHLVIAQAQTPKLDSLNRLISQAATDTGRINLINQKIRLLSEINIDSALSLSQQTVERAKRISYKEGEAFARVRLAMNYNLKGNYPAAKKNLRLAESMYATMNDSAQLIKVYNAYGTMYGMQSKYDSSIVFFEKSKGIAERNNIKGDLGSVYLNIGASYTMLSNQRQALIYQQKALMLAEAQHNLSDQAYCRVNLASTYRATGNIKRAAQQFTQAITLAKSEGIRNVELYAYTNLAAMYGDMNDSRKTYDYAMKAAALARQVGDQSIQAVSLSRAAVSLAAQKKFAQAQDLAKQAMAIADQSHQPLILHQTYAAMGNVLNQQGNCSAAIPYYEKSFQVLKQADIYDAQIGQAYAELSSCYEKTGHYRQALTMYKQSAAITDSIRGKENIQKATELTLTYEFTKKQQATQAEQQKQRALARTKQVALGGGMGLMLILAAVSFYAYRTKYKANTLLQQQKEELQRALTKLKTTQTQLIQSEKMASLGELTAGIAHEIQNPLNFVNNFSEVSTELIDELKEGPFQELPNAEKDYAQEILGDLTQNLQKIAHHGSRASSIIKGMLEHSRASTGERQFMDLNALADEYLRLTYQGQRAKDKSFSCEIVTDFASALGQVEMVPQELGRVLMNLYNNAFYAVSQRARESSADAYQPTVEVRTHRQEDEVVIRVSDNGTGIPESVISKIFQPFFTTKPTGEGTGLGLSLSYDIITKGHGGRLRVDSQLGEGTTFSVELPYRQKI